MKTLTRNQALEAAADPERLARIIGWPFPRWARQCHAVSTKLLYSGAFGPGRIARGSCRGVTSQHSWIVLGDDCYDPGAIIVDPTLWSYDSDIGSIIVTTMAEARRHRPHGSGSCFETGMPGHHGGDDIELTPARPLSVTARVFLDSIGPLDLRGWSEVAHLPVQDWPAAEILGAMCDTPGLGVLIPIDTKGMVAGRVPGYRWPELSSLTPDQEARTP